MPPTKCKVFKPHLNIVTKKKEKTALHIFLGKKRVCACGQERWDGLL